MQGPSSSEPRPRSRRGEGDQLRELLVDAAVRMLADVRDVQELSVRAVTRAVGVSPAALYLHFPDKATLAVAVRDRGFAMLLERLVAAERSAGDDPFARLAAMATSYLDFAREHDALYAALFSTFVPRAGVPLPPSDDGLGPGERVFAVVRAAISNGLAAAGQQPDERRVFEEATVLWMALHGRAAVARAMPSFPFPEATQFVDLLTDRLRSPISVNAQDVAAGNGGAPRKEQP